MKVTVMDQTQFINSARNLNKADEVEAVRVIINIDGKEFTLYEEEGTLKIVNRDRLLVYPDAANHISVDYRK